MASDVHTSGLACAGLSDSSPYPPPLAPDQSLQRRLGREGGDTRSDALQQQPSKYRTKPRPGEAGGRGKKSPSADGEAGPLRDPAGNATP
ncbi:unnamed protein product [Arctogadus glacialis]